MRFRNSLFRCFQIFSFIHKRKNIFTFLQKAMSSYEDRPEEMITEVKFGDSLFLIRGHDQARAAWHYIAVPIDKLDSLKAKTAGSNINVTQFGQMIEYRDHQGITKFMSGWGKDPPKIIDIWLDEIYGQ